MCFFGYDCEVHSYRLSPKCPHRTKCQELLQVYKEKRWQLSGGKKEEELQKGPGASNIQHSAQIVFTLISCPQWLRSAPHFAVNSQKEPTLPYSDSILTPSSHTTHPPPNHVTKASLIYLGLLETGIQKGPCHPCPSYLNESKGRLFGLSVSSYSHFSVWNHFHLKV